MPTLKEATDIIYGAARDAWVAGTDNRFGIASHQLFFPEEEQEDTPGPESLYGNLIDNVVDSRQTSLGHPCKRWRTTGLCFLEIYYPFSRRGELDDIVTAVIDELLKPRSGIILSRQTPLKLGRGTTHYRRDVRFRYEYDTQRIILP